MTKMVHAARPAFGFVLALILMLATAGDAVAQRAGTTSSRGSKVEKREQRTGKSKPRVERRSSARTRSAPKRDSRTRSTPQRDSRTRSAPKRDSRTRSAPKRDSRTRSAPQRDSRTRSTPQRDSRTRSTPQRDSRTRSTPQRDSRTRSAPQRDSRTRSTPQRDSRTRSTPQERGSRGATVPRRDDRTRATPNRGTGGTAVDRNRGRGDARGQGTRRGNDDDRRGQGTRRGDDDRRRGDGRLNNNRRGGSGYGGRIESRRPRHGADYRHGVRIDGRRSKLKHRNGRRLIAPSRRWVYRRPHYPRIRYHTPRLLRVHRPNIYVHIDWPWVVRYQRHWAPRYRYRQVVYVETVVRGRPSRAQVEVETVYSHNLVYANDDYAEIDIEIERFDLYQNGRYLGYVDRLPARLSEMTATVYRNGEVYFDREIFILGDTYSGFEVLSTHAYDGYVLDDYHYDDGYRVGRVDLRRHKVTTKKNSRLFKPHRSQAHVPISLLPSDEGWLWDYGVDAISAAVDDYDWYYGAYGSRAPRTLSTEPYRQEDQWTWSRDGADVSFKRESHIQRVQ
ncbi:MAG: hypothetical protein JJ896_13880 [Rhodothermales bacterium]|nr:hypothetical protein [Rhodothermales bacterium]MBO6780739.1 hypothetical protein [Rhodothermales bacterium]